VLIAVNVATPAPVIDQLGSTRLRSDVEALPIVTVPEYVPVPMFVAARPEALMLVAPVRVKPPVPWIRPEPELTPTEVIKPAAVTVPVKFAEDDIV
jgi:hypothetical protein